MSPNDSKLSSPRSNAIIVLATLLLVPAFANADITDLAGLARLEGEAYVARREALLEPRAHPWGVHQATARSWELGLAAYILNQRLSKPEAFKKLDNEHPRSYRHVHGYGKMTGFPEANTAFLLEKMWKAPSPQNNREEVVQPEQDKQYAFNTLIKRRVFRRAGETTLWKSIWEECEDDRFRFVALEQVCADPAPAVQPLIVEVLHADDDILAGYSARSRCLKGMMHRDTEQTVIAVLDALEVLKRERKLSAAIRVLAANSSLSARRFVHEFILDPNNKDALRGEAIVWCCDRPHPDDTQMTRQFLAAPVATHIKTKILNNIGSHCTLDHVRSIVREILTESEDAKILAAAALGLRSAYILAKNASEADKESDAALLEELLRTASGLTDANRIHIQMYIEGLRAKPGDPKPRLPD